MHRIWPITIGNTIGFWIVLTVLLCPLVYLPGILDYAQLPKTAMILISAGLLLVLWSVYIVAGGRIRCGQPALSAMILAFLTWGLISLAWAQNRINGILVITHWLACGAFFMVITTMALPRIWTGRVLKAMCLSAVAVAAIGLLQSWTAFDLIPQIAAPAATFGNRNLAAGFTSLALPLLINGLMTRFNMKSRLANGIGLCAILLFVITAGHRASWVAGFCGIAIVLLPVWRRAIVKSKAKSAGFFLACVVFLGLGIGGGMKLLRQADSGANPLRHAVVVDDQEVYPDSMKVRLNLWQNSLAMIQDRSLAGTGIGNFKTFYPLYHRARVKDLIFRETLRPQNVHNDLIQIWTELGSIGLLIWIGIWICLVRYIYRAMYTKSRDRDNTAVWGIAGSLTVFFVQGLFSFPLYAEIPPLWCFIFLALIMQMKHCPESSPPSSSGRPRLYIGGLMCLGATGLLLLGSYANLRMLIADRYLLAARWAESQGQWQEAITAGEKATRYNPYALDAWAVLGRAYLETGQAAKAIADQARVLNPDPYNINVLLNQGVACYQDGEPQKAIWYLNRAIAVKPDFAKALINLGKIHLRNKDFTKALACFSKAVLYDPQNPMLHNNLGFLYYQKGDYKAAAKQYELVLKYAPDMTFVNKILDHINAKALNQLQAVSGQSRPYTARQVE